MNKPSLIRHLGAILADKVEAVRSEIIATRETFNSDTKSSAGDKHEVGHAMVQQELDKLEEQLSKLIALRQELARVPLDRTFDRVAFGSLVITDQGNYFVAIGLGRIELNGEPYFAISPASPIGQALLDRRVDDHVDFNGRALLVRAIG